MADPAARALLLAPTGRDAEIAAALLVEAGIAASICLSIPALIAELDREAGFVVIAEEAIASADVAPLADWLARQEEWSDMPFVLLTGRGGGLERNPAAARHLDLLGNVTFLERPFHPTTFVSLARSALRGRRRQYEARARLLALRESEARYRVLFDTMDEGFAVIRFIDGPEGPLSDYVHTQANPAYERHAGISNIVGKRLREIVSPSEADAWATIYRRVLETGEPIRFDRELVETGRHLELAAFRVETRGRREVAVVFQDATSRRRAEIELRELNETLERRVAATVAEREAAAAQLHEAQKIETLGQLTGGVAHDVNNLLTPITGALDLLGRRYGPTDPKAERLIDGALQSAERARLLVSRLLGFARRQALETRPLDIARIIDGMRDLLASSIGSGIELTISAPDDLPPAMADANQFELALLNLGVNARDAMPDGGRLSVIAEACTIRPGDRTKLVPGEYIKVSVIDTGTGMDEATLTRAVEPFYSTKDVGRGTGLGLSMVHGLAAQLGGAFLLTSRLGHGTRAELYLPVAKAAAAPLRVSGNRPIARSRPLKLLLVDDEDLVRIGTAEMLRDLGHEVHEAANGPRALALLRGGLAVDAIITDFMMPRMNGAEFARQAQALSPGVPVLLVTGYAGGELNLPLPQLAKPFRQPDLSAALEELVGVRQTAAAG